MEKNKKKFFTLTGREATFYMRVYLRIFILESFNQGATYLMYSRIGIELHCQYTRPWKKFYSFDSSFFKDSLLSFFKSGGYLQVIGVV